MRKSSPHQRTRIINAVAPIRICDCGGWTDTWFARYGSIFNIAVAPYAEVQIEVYPQENWPDRVFLSVDNYGDHYPVDLNRSDWERHPLLEAAIRRVGVPDGLAIRIHIFSEAPSGASTGTSAAVAVALIGALDCLTPGGMTPHEIAYEAHAVETEMLGRQSGIQDQLCSAYGGINFISMSEYPRAEVRPIRVSEEVWWELERRLVLVYLGKSHDSSQVHEKVIAELDNAGPEGPQLQGLRAAALKAVQAISNGDFPALGQAMIDNTAAQTRLHTELVSREAWRVIEITQEHGAAGWKVNGAGGAGGSLTILCGPNAGDKLAMIREIQSESPWFRIIPIRMDPHGLRRWETI